MRALILLVLLCGGCYTPFNDLKGRIPNKQWVVKHHKTVDAVKKYYFAPKAYEVIKDIPCVDGFTSGGSYVVGVNFWGTLVGIVTGSGYSPKCVMSKKSVKNEGVEAILHEYIHHIEHLVDHKRFREAYVKMSKDRRWVGLFLYGETRGNWWVTNTFGISEASEYIAYVLGRMLTQGSGPGYMWDVFQGVLRAPWEAR
jgi:hypothetical protein